MSLVVPKPILSAFVGYGPQESPSRSVRPDSLDELHFGHAAFRGGLAWRPRGAATRRFPRASDDVGSQPPPAHSGFVQGAHVQHAQFMASNMPMYPGHTAAHAASYPPTPGGIASNFAAGAHGVDAPLGTRTCSRSRSPRGAAPRTTQVPQFPDDNSRVSSAFRSLGLGHVHGSKRVTPKKL